MIPLKLTIEGLYSYRTRQTIDFTNLTQSGLFGIFGGVGSGKSSILEAISFALYNESQRLNTRGDDRNYNMMNLKSDRLFIDFEFKSGKDNIYRFVAEGKRNSKKFEDVKAFDRKAYHLDNDEWIPIDPDSIETITGLNYENFHRTIIIPQGKFAEFIGLSASERTIMLMELFNLSKYDLYDKISRLEGRNNTEITRISSTMEGIGEVSPDQIRILSAKEKDLHQQIGKLIKDTGENELAEQRLENVRTLSIDIASRKARLDELKGSETEIVGLEKEIKEYERIHRNFRADMTRLNETERNLYNTNKKLKAAEGQLRENQHELALILPVHKELKRSYDKRDQLIRESEELKKLAEIRKLETGSSKLMEKALAIRATLKKAEELISSSREKHAAKSRELDQLMEIRPDIKMLADIKDWFRENKRISRDINERQTRYVTNDSAMTENRERIITELNDSGLFRSIPDDTSLISLRSMVEEGVLAIENSLEEIIQQRTELEVRQGLEQYASALEEGKPCPLCGSTVHPRLLDPTDVDSRLENLKAGINTLNDQLKAHRQLEKGVINGQSTEDGLIRQNESIHSELLFLISEQNAHLKKFKWMGYTPEDENRIAEEDLRYVKIQESISRIEKEMKAIAKAVEDNRDTREGLNREAGQVNERLTATKSRIELLTGQIIIINMKELENQTAEQLEEKAAERKMEHAELVRKFSEKEKERDDLQSAVTALTGEVSALQKAGGELMERLELIRRNLMAKLEAQGRLELSYVQSVLEKDMDVDAIRTTIEKYRQEVGSICKYLAEKEKELGGRVYDEKAHHQLKQAIVQQKERAVAVNREIGELQQEITTLMNNAVRYEALRGELEKAKIRGKDIGELKALFRGSGFVNYVSTIYLQDLCRAANERFYRLTRQQLGLELASDNTFLVRDYMNEGRVRSAKSLSGGQTFQASLSMALALADSIHRLAGSGENFFFLDEGFGSLDKETLDVAFDTLKSLRRENRIVGVISHVEEMQTEIETYLKVTNDEEYGSIVKTSWEGV
ncbi:MAG TPA: SMC family ATPase [Bacteroidales bacterium]|nr:SMC family ATPase [Bacteroidales bacterium]